MGWTVGRRSTVGSRGLTDSPTAVEHSTDAALGAAALVCVLTGHVQVQMCDIYFYGYAKEWGEFTSFYVAPFEVEDRKYATVEHYYQSMKFVGTPQAEEIRNAPTAEEARRIGNSRNYPLRSDWEDTKIQIMLTGLRAKFHQQERLRDKLLSTGERSLIFEDPQDSFWGNGLTKDGRPGKNLYGKMLEQVRTEIKTLRDDQHGWTLLGHAAVLCAVYPLDRQCHQGTVEAFAGNKAALARSAHARMKRGHAIDRQALVLDETNLAALEEAFRTMDEDDSGFLSIFELQHLWAAVFVDLLPEEVQRITEHIWPDIDADDDDEISFEELVTYLRAVARQGDANEMDAMLGLEERRPRPTEWDEWVWAIVDQAAGERYLLSWLRQASVAWAMAMQLAILTSILVMVIESLPELTNDLGEHGNESTEGIETVCIGIFTVEFLARFISTPSQRELWGSFFTYVDLLAILPFYLSVSGVTSGNSSADSLTVLRALRFVRLVRVLRVIKLGRNAEGIQLMTVAMSRSRLALAWALVLIIMAVVLFSSLIFYVEKEDCSFNTSYTLVPGGPKLRVWVRNRNSTYLDAGERIDLQSIPDAMWWAIVTLTTTGFGDQFVRTHMAKAAASAAMGSGLLVLAYPVTVISTNFAEVQQEFDERRKKQRRREQFQRRLADQKQREADKQRRLAFMRAPNRALARRESVVQLTGLAEEKGHGATLSSTSFRPQQQGQFRKARSTLHRAQSMSPPRTAAMIHDLRADRTALQTQSMHHLDRPSFERTALEISDDESEYMQRSPRRMPHHGSFLGLHLDRCNTGSELGASVSESTLARKEGGSDAPSYLGLLPSNPLLGPSLNSSLAVPALQPGTGSGPLGRHTARAPSEVGQGRAPHNMASGVPRRSRGSSTVTNPDHGGKGVPLQHMEQQLLHLQITVEELTERLRRLLPAQGAARKAAAQPAPQPLPPRPDGVHPLVPEQRRELLDPALPTPLAPQQQQQDASRGERPTMSVNSTGSWPGLESPAAQPPGAGQCREPAALPTTVRQAVGGSPGQVPPPPLLTAIAAGTSGPCSSPQPGGPSPPWRPCQGVGPQPPAAPAADSAAAAAAPPAAPAEALSPAKAAWCRRAAAPPPAACAPHPLSASPTPLPAPPPAAAAATTTADASPRVISPPPEEGRCSGRRRRRRGKPEARCRTLSPRRPQAAFS